MPTYLLHGFRWPRDLIRVHFILNHLENRHPPEWIMAPSTADALRRNLIHLHPDAMDALPNLSFIEQFNAKHASAALPSQPFAYVADVVQEITLGLAVDDVTTQGIDNEQWAAMMDLRDQLAPSEKVAWFVVVCGDEERIAEAERPRLVSRDGWNRPPQEPGWDIAGMSLRQPRLLRRLFSSGTLRDKKKGAKTLEEVRPSSSHTITKAAPTQTNHGSIPLDSRLPSIAKNRLSVRPRTSESAQKSSRLHDMIPDVPRLTVHPHPRSPPRQASATNRNSLATRWNPEGFEPAFEQKMLLNEPAQDDSKSPTPPLEEDDDDDSSINESTSARDTDRSVSPVRTLLPGSDFNQDVSPTVAVYRPGNAFPNNSHDYMKNQHLEALEALNGKTPPLACETPIVPRDKASKRHSLPVNFESDTDESDYSDVPKSIRKMNFKRKTKNREKRFSAISSVSAFSQIDEEEETSDDAGIPKKMMNDGEMYFGQKVDERDLIATGLEDCFSQF